MNANPTAMTRKTRELSEHGRDRLLSQRGEPLFLAGWQRVLFIHFEVAPEVLQRVVPYPLDLYQGRAFVSLVAFTMRGLRPRLGGSLTAWPFRWMGDQRFLNVRTYVSHGNQRGIYFITEWLSSWLNVQLGPWLYGLPYQHAAIDYRHEHEKGMLRGSVRSKTTGKSLVYESPLSKDAPFTPVEQHSRDEFLLERYTAYTAHGSGRRFFRIWHPPWPQLPVTIARMDGSLVTATFPWFTEARCVGANYSPGFDDVWMSRAFRIQ